MLRATPPGEDGVDYPRAAAGEIENEAYEQTAGHKLGDLTRTDEDDFNEKPTEREFLQMVSEAEEQALLYINQVNRKAWTRVYRAFHQEHFNGSKYDSRDFKNRSKFFIPKTRTAIKKDLAAVAASLFGNLDAITTSPGNESDAQQRASAAIIQELINYRTDRTSGKASIPWFMVAMGARQTSQLAGICLSKQSWKLELRRKGSETVDEEDEETGDTVKRERDVWVPQIDRPDSELIPPENFVIDPAANWTNPAQDAAYLIIKWPMRIDEIRRKSKDPRRPWRYVSDAKLRAAGQAAKFDMEAIRRAREQGLDRFNETQTGPNFDVIWVYETFIRTAGEDWTFLSVGQHEMLTDPVPVIEAYPEQFGERPLVMGYGEFEAFRIFPMSPADSWQMLQMETNDLRNLTMDAIKQNIAPVSKVVRGRQVDLDQLRRRGQGTSIMVTKADDVTWDRPPDIPASVKDLKMQLDIDFDDLAGQQNYNSVATNNALGETLGGLKLAAGSANAVQEFNIRIWIETWAEPVLAQLVRLEQYYESDTEVLGLCGERAQLLQKYGVSEINNELLENQVTVRVSVGLGAGDPQQRLAKFQSATSVALPLLQLSKEFQSGEMTIDPVAVMDEVYGAAGYRDGGKRFIKKGQPSQNPMQQPELDKLVAETQLKRAQAKKAILDALSNAAKVGIDVRAMEAQIAADQFGQHIDHVDQMGRAVDMGIKHGQMIHQLRNPQPNAGEAGPASGDAGGGVGAGASDAAPAPAAAAGGGGEAPPSEGAAAPPLGPTDVGAGNAPLAAQDLSREGVPAADAGEQQQQDEASQAANLKKATAPKKRRITFHRDPKTNRIAGADVSEGDYETAPTGKAQPDERSNRRDKQIEKLSSLVDKLNKPNKTSRDDHIAKLSSLVDKLNKPRKVARDGQGNISGFRDEISKLLLEIAAELRTET